jgi:hypothetical protein
MAQVIYDGTSDLFCALPLTVHHPSKTPTYNACEAEVKPHIAVIMFPVRHLRGTHNECVKQETTTTDTCQQNAACE